MTASLGIRHLDRVRHRIGIFAAVLQGLDPEALRLEKEALELSFGAGSRHRSAPGALFRR